MVASDQGKPEAIPNKRRDSFAASEVAGIESPEARRLAVDFAVGLVCGQPGRKRQYVKVGRGRGSRR